ncbi:folate family ECF transporter S component [bacterium]|nr:folate family ECF transporter S component [bacterium]
MKHNFFSARRLVFLSFLIALSIIFTRVLSLRITLLGVERIRIGLGAFPIIFSGIAFGPICGSIVGILSDIQGYFVNPVGPYIPYFTITSGLTGFIPGFLIYFFLKGKKDYLTLLIAIGSGQLCTTVLLVPFIHNKLFGIPVKPLILASFIIQILIVIIYVFLCRRLLKFKIFDRI